MAATSVRFNNDTERDVDLLWHRPMEGGLIVATAIATIAAGRSRVMRGFAGHEFSVYEDDDELQHWTLLKRKQQTFNVSSAEPVLAPGAAAKKRKQNKKRSAATSSEATAGAAAAQAADKAELGDTIVLQGSFIKGFDGRFTRKGDANGKPHWASVSGMHVYWGPRDMWLLRARFTPGEPTASAYCHSEQLQIGHENDFNWSTPSGGWVASKLTILNAVATAALEGTADMAATRTATIVRFAGCLVPKFNGDYKLQPTKCNGHPHWFCDDKTEGGLHLYFGPQGLWLLRSIFRPAEKACSAYCAAAAMPIGSEETWHWMRSGGWHEQQLRPAPLFVGMETEDAAAAAAVMTGDDTGADAEKVSDDDDGDDDDDDNDDDDEGDDGGGGEEDLEEEEEDGVEETAWSGEPPEVGEEGPLPEGSLQIKRTRSGGDNTDNDDDDNNNDDEDDDEEDDEEDETQSSLAKRQRRKIESAHGDGSASVKLGERSDALANYLRGPSRKQEHGLVRDAFCE